MPQPNSFDPSSPPPIGQRRCPICGVPMFMARIEPTDKYRRTFECLSCNYDETTIDEFR
jgi:transposase-like protein